MEILVCVCLMVFGFINSKRLRRGNAVPIVEDEKARLERERKNRILRLRNVNWKYKGTKANLVNEIFVWSSPFFAEREILHRPNVHFSYAKNPRWGGTYNGGHDDYILVYLSNKYGLYDVIHTIMHEIRHFIQHKGDRLEFRKYYQYTEQYGYWDNPFEVDARAFSDEFTEKCMQYLIDNGSIVWKDTYPVYGRKFQV